MRPESLRCRPVKPVTLLGCPARSGSGLPGAALRVSA